MQKRASLERRLQSQSLESRQLLAGPELVGIAPNSGQLIAGGTSLDGVPNQGVELLTVSPQELTFRFDDSTPINPDTLGTAEDPLAITITRADADGTFEAASATTDFATNALLQQPGGSGVLSPGGSVLLEFRADAAQFPGVSGNGIRIDLSSTDRGSGGTPVLFTVLPGTDSKPQILISLNSNAVRPATMRDLVLASQAPDSPVQGILQSLEIRGETLTPIGRSIPAGGLSLTLDGANAASVTTDLGLGEGTAVRIIADQSGAAGRDIRVNLTQRNFSAPTAPLVTVTGTTINIQTNSNPANATTIAELIAAINDTPTVASLVTARLERGDLTDTIAPTFGGVLQLTGASDTVVPAGYVGIGNSPNEVVFRFAEPLPDDTYQIEVYGEGPRALLNQNDEPFNDGEDFAVQFNVNVAPRVTAIVPEPIRRNVDGSFSPQLNVIEVHFTQDVTSSVLNPDFYELIYGLDTASGLDDITYDDVAAQFNLAPLEVNVPDASRPNVVELTFDRPLSRMPDPSITPPMIPDPANPGSSIPDPNFVAPSIDGTARLKIGGNSALPAVPSEVSVASDAGDSFFSSQLIDLANPTSGQTITTRLIDGEIVNVDPFDLQFPGGSDYQGVREVRPDDPSRLDRTVPLDIWRRGADTFDGITTAYYNFPSEYSTEEGGDQTFSNLIANLPQQQQRVREVISLFSDYLGVQFIEIGDTASGAVSVPDATDGPLFSIGVGDLAAVGGISGAGGVTLDTTTLGDNQDLLVMDFQDFDESVDDQVGGEFFRGAFLGIGQLLGYGYADHLAQPVTQSTEAVLDDPPFTPLDPDDPDLRSVPALSSDLPSANEPLFPSPADIVNGQYLFRPESNDIDLYRFELTNPGKLTLSTIAERLPSASSLDTALRLYQLQGDEYVEIAANDDYFSNDSLIEIDVDAGTYVVGVSASGNTSYNPIIAGSGIGGVTQGSYELVMSIETVAADSIVDFAVGGSSNRLDGDADGTAGGDFNYWFDPTDPDTTLYVDSLGGGGVGGIGADEGSILRPFREIDRAILAAEQRIGTDNEVETIRVIGGGTYQIGRDSAGRSLRDGATLDVPQNVNLIIDAGSTFQMSRSRIGVGSTTEAIDRSGSSIQVLGTPDENVRFIGLTDTPRFNDPTDPLLDTDAVPGTWGGIDIRGDLDFADDSKVNLEDAAVFLNHIQYADIMHGGGEVLIDSVRRDVTPIELADVRATVMNNQISQSASAAISATPNTFEETRFDEPRFQNEFLAGGTSPTFFTSDVSRVGPHINGNRIVDNTINGLQILVDTPTGGSLTPLTVNARFDDTDIVHVLTENLLIEGAAGGVSAGLTIPSVLLVTGEAVPNELNTAPEDRGDIPAGEYGYRVTFVDQNGFETAPSEASGTVTLGVTGKIELNNLPVVASDEFTGRRLYRAPVVGTGIDGSPLFGEFRRVARLNGSDSSFVDTALAGTNLLDQAVIDDPTAARAGRLDPGLTIDPGTVLKLDGSRIDVTFDAHFYAEGTQAQPIVITSLSDARYGAGGTFNTGSITNGEVAPGDWGGIFLGYGAHGSLDHAVVAGGGGVTRIEGGLASFNVLESHQSELRVANSRFEMNADGRTFLNDNANNTNNPDDVREERVGRANNASGTIFVRGSQPVITGNDFIDGSGPVMSFDVNSFSWNEQLDYGRSTGLLDASDIQGNSGPLISGNRIDVSGDNGTCVTDAFGQSPTDAEGNVITCGLNGLEVRGGEVATEVVWDDTDIVHIVRDMIEVPNQHIYGGLRLESDSRGSLVVKFLNPDDDGDDSNERDILRERQAGIVVGGDLISASDQFIDISDRIGGSLQIVGQPDFPVVLTSLLDDTVGAGFTPDGRANVDTDNNGVLLDENGDPIFIPIADSNPSAAPALLPLGPEFDRTDRAEVDNGPLIDNDIDPNNVGFFEADVLSGGQVETVTVSGQDQVADNPLLQQTYDMLYTTFLDVTAVNIPGVVEPLPVSLFEAFEGVQAPIPQLISPDRVRTTGVYNIDTILDRRGRTNGLFAFNQSYRWTVETFFVDNRAVLYSTIDIETVDGTTFRSNLVSDLEIISYLDQGIPDADNDVLYRLGTPGNDDFRLLTINQDSRVGFSHGGIYENDSLNQFNADYLGWATDDPDVFLANTNLAIEQANISLDGDVPDNWGEVNVVDAPLFAGVTAETRALGLGAPGAGAPTDIATVHEWRFNAGSDAGRITTFVEWIPSDPADPFDIVLTSPILNSGTWDGITIREAASDFNVAVTAESEPGNIGRGPTNDFNAIPDTAQYLGEIAPTVAAGDDSRRIGLIVDGELSQVGDEDVYSFIAEAGTQVWLDIDRTDARVDTIVELINANGETLVLSDDSVDEAVILEQLQSGTAAQRATAEAQLNGRVGGGFSPDRVLGLGTTIADVSAGRAVYQDQYSTNSKDAGMRLILPGEIGKRQVYHVRVRSVMDALDTATIPLTSSASLGRGVTTGAYQLQVRLTEEDVFPGTQVRYSDVRFAVNGVQIINGPLHSPLTGDDYEVARDNDTLIGAQRLGLYDGQFEFGAVPQEITDFLNDNDAGGGDPITVAELVAAFPDTFVSPDGIQIVRDSDGVLRVDIDISNAGGPLSSDRLAKSISGSLSGEDDVDWYEFDIEYQQLTRDDARLYLATVFDIDYADGLARADTALYVFDSTGALVLIGGDSNIADDQRAPGTSATDDLSRGSFGTADPYIGSAELPEGTYYVAVANQSRGPVNLDQFTNRDSANPLLRLEPIDSIQRIAEERFEGFEFYPGTFGTPTIPVLFDDSSIIDYSLDDVLVYVNTASTLFLVNPFTGENYGAVGQFGDEVLDVAFTANGELFGYTGFNNRGPGDANFSYNRIDTSNADLTQINVGGGITTFHDLEVEQVLDANGNILPLAQILDVASDDGIEVEGITIRARNGIETGFLVGNRPIQRAGLEYTQNILYAFNEDTGAIVGPAFDQFIGDPAVELVSGAGTGPREIGFIDTDPPSTDFNQLGLSDATVANNQGIGLPTLFDGDAFTIEDGVNTLTFELNQGFTLIAESPALIPNFQTLAVTLPGEGVRTFEFTDNAANVTSGNTPLVVDRTASSSAFISQLAANLSAEGIPVSSSGIQLAFPTASLVELSDPGLANLGGVTLTGNSGVGLGNVAITLLPTDTAEVLAQRIEQAVATASNSALLDNVTATPQGGSLEITGLVTNIVDATVGDATLNGLVAGGFANRSGLVGGGFANGGLITGVEMIGNDLYAISNTGGLYFVPSGSLNSSVTENVGQYVRTATELRGINFTGLRAGPASVNGGAYANLLFGTTAAGEIYAFNTNGELQPVFAGGRSSIQTGIFGLQGIDFSTLDYNLWHVTTARSGEAGHGLNQQFSDTRFGQTGGGSLAFNYETTAFNNLYSAGEQPAAALAAGDPADLTDRQDGQGVRDTYNFPGGAKGTVQSNAFSLEGYSAADQPHLYFNYFLETDGIDSDTNDTGILFEDQDSLRVYIIDANGVEHLVATNNEALDDVPDGLLIVDEFDDPSNAVGSNYEDDIDVEVQQLFDNTGSWRQARVPLGEFAGQAGLGIRIEFSTAGTTFTETPELRAVDASALTQGASIIVNGETFSIDFSPAISFPSGVQLSSLYTADPTNPATFTVDGQTYALTDGGQVIPAGLNAIEINLLDGQPAGVELADLSSADIAQAVRDVFDTSIDLERLVPSGPELVIAYQDPDARVDVFLNGSTFVLNDGFRVIEETETVIDVSVADEFNALNPDEEPKTLAELTAADVGSVLAARIGEADQAVEYDQLVPSNAELSSLYLDSEALFVVTIDGQQYALDDLATTPPRNITADMVRVVIPDLARSDIPAELQAAVEQQLGIQTPVFNTTNGFDFDDPSGGSNDVLFQATALPYGGGNAVINGSGTLGPVDRADVDLSSIDLTAGTTLSVELDSNNFGVLLNARFFDADGNELTNVFRQDPINNGPTDVVTFTVTVPRTGRYFIGISGPENNSYDPRISGSGDAAQIGAYDVQLVVTPDSIVENTNGIVEFTGVGSLSVAAGFGLSTLTQNAVAGNSVPISRFDSARDVADSLRAVLADRFSDGDLSQIPQSGSSLRLANLTLESTGPFTLTDSRVEGDRYGDLFGAGFVDGASDNDHNGAFIDDIIIGFAERGELVTAANPIGVNQTFDLNPFLENTNPIPTEDPTTSGAYQLEIRDASEYVRSQDVPVGDVAPDARFRAFDTNERLASGTTITTLPAAAIVDGATFTIADADTRLVFEFDIRDENGNSNGFVNNANRVIVSLSQEATATEVADAVISLINSNQVQAVLNARAARSNGTTVNGGENAPDSRINIYGDVSLRDNAEGLTTFESIVNGELRGDQNRDREQQGVILIEANRFLFSEQSGVRINREDQQRVVGRDAFDETPAVLSYPRNLVELNTENLIPGVTVRDNVMAFNADSGVYISGLDGGGVSAENPVGFDRIFNNTIIGGTIAPGPDLGSQVFSSILFEQGGISFADSVVIETLNLGADVNQEFTDTDAALSAPDGNGIGLEPETGQFALSLGSGGEATFRFEDNLLTGDGTSNADLVIFEIGTPERVGVEISRDGVNFIDVGEVFGIDNTIDLDQFGFGRNDQFAFVRLTDLSPAGSFEFGAAGADIDSVGAISTTVREIYTPGSQGIVVRQNSAPTLLNNIVANLQTGISVELPQNNLPADVDVSGDLTVIDHTTYFRNANNAGSREVQSTGTSAQFISPFEQIFVDPIDLIFTPQSGTITIDSGVASLDERASLETVKTAVGLPVSPIIVSSSDLNGQLRIDNPDVSSPGGVGFSSFVDRGAEERRDADGPRAVLSSPRGDDLFGDAGRSVTARGTIFDAFEIQLIDGIAPAESAPGVGIDDGTVLSDLVRLTRLVEGSDRVETLAEGVDYRFAYEPADNTIRLTPVAGIWADDSVYTIEVLGNELSEDENGVTSVLRAREGQFYADGAVTEVAEQILEADTGIILSVFLGALTAADPVAGTPAVTIDGQLVTVFDGISEVTFEFDTEPIPDFDVLNTVVRVPEAATAPQIARALADAINDSTLQLIAISLSDTGEVGADGRVQLLGISDQSELAYVTLDEDSFLRQSNEVLDVQLAIEVDDGIAGERFTDFNNQLLSIFDGQQELTFEFDTDGIQIDPNALLIAVNNDATPREIVQALIERIEQTDLAVEVSGSSGTFRIAGTNGPISVSSTTDSAVVSGNSRIGVSPGFGIEIPTVDGAVSDAVEDGQTFTITRATDLPVTFELDFDGGLENTAVVPVEVIGVDFTESPDAIADALVLAIQDQFPGLTPVNIGGGRVTLGGDEFFSLNVAGSALQAIGFGGREASVPIVIPMDDVRDDTLERLVEKFGATNPTVEVLSTPLSNEHRIAGQYFDALESELTAGLTRFGSLTDALSQTPAVTAPFVVETLGGDGEVNRIQIYAENDQGLLVTQYDIERVDRRLIIRQTGLTNDESVPAVRGESVVQDRIADEVGNELLFGDAVVIVGSLFDYGDAPAPYPTTIDDNGPRHAITENLYLGFGVSEDTDGNPNDLDDDDGVQLAGSLQPGFSSSFVVTINGADAIDPTLPMFYLDIWFDFNGDGIFENNSEELYRFNSTGAGSPGTRVIGQGVNPAFPISVPATTPLGDLQVRARLSFDSTLATDPSRGPVGRADSGEVEDYTFQVISNPFQNPSIAADVNGSGEVSSIDALQVINTINVAGGNVDLGLPVGFELPQFPDVNGDGEVSALDALRVINYLNGVIPSSEPAVGEPLFESDQTTATVYAPVGAGLMASGATIATTPVEPTSATSSGTKDLATASKQ
ncbi:MAG: dockerin type I domain-containing protein, partial [Planctomycetota bacterium]